MNTTRNQPINESVLRALGLPAASCVIRRGGRSTGDRQGMQAGRRTNTIRPTIYFMIRSSIRN
jgi:hypothetical protein